MLKSFEKLFAIVMLSYGCGAFTWLCRSAQTADSGDSARELAVQTALYAVASLLFLVNANRIVTGLLNARWLVALVLLAISSTFWSEDPSLTLRRSLVLAATLIYGIYFGSRFEFDEQLRILAWTLLLLLAMSTVVAVAIPTYGTDAGPHLGNWRGLFIQKNTLARIAVLAFSVFFCWEPRLWLSRQSALCFAVLVVAMTRSATAVVLLSLLLVLLILLRAAQSRSAKSITAAVSVFVLASAVGVFLMSNFEAVLAVLGRDPTLTGRTDLWRAVLVAISKHPLLGYGFDAFWRGVAGESASVVLTVHWLVKHSHNGLLDLWLNLGAAGLFLIVMAYLAAVSKAFRLYRRFRNPAASWPLAYLVFLFFYNFTESTLLEQNSIFTILLAATAVTLASKRAWQERTCCPGQHRISESCTPLLRNATDKLILLREPPGNCAPIPETSESLPATVRFLSKKSQLLENSSPLPTN